MKIELVFGKCYRITLKDRTTFRFRFNGNVPGEGLCERVDEYSDVFDFDQTGLFESIGCGD